jgi:diguanylate cyclase (GGDEF)-like protein/PAS domain S-box-containing protein
MFSVGERIMDDCKRTAAEALRTEVDFSLLRRLSLSSLIAMLITAAVLIFLYRQDQIAEQEVIAAHANEHTLMHLVKQFGDQFESFAVSVRADDAQALKANPGIDRLLAEVGKVSEQPWLKLKIYNLSGLVVLSSAKEEIGGISDHPDWVAKALRGELTSRIAYRDTFLSATGEMQHVYIATTYMPFNYGGKLVGVIEIYRDVSPLFERIHANTIKIALAVFSAFAMLYLVLFCAVLRTDRAVAKWQRAVADSEASLRESQIIAGLGSYVLYIGTGIWKSSAVLDQLFGIDETYEHSMAGWKALVHPDDRAMMADYFRDEVIGQGKAFDRQFRIIRHSDRVERWMHGLGKLKFDAQGHPQKLHGTLQDITERKQVEERMHCSKLLLQQTQAVAKIGSWRINVPRNELSWTEETYRIFGVPVGTPMTYECFLDRVYPDDRAMVDFAWQAALKGAPYHVKHRLVVGGEIRWVEENARLDFDEQGNLYSSMGSVQDITERKQAEADLRIAATAFESQESLMVTDANGVILRINQAFTETSGYSAAEVLGKPASILNSGRHAPAFYRAMWAAIKRTGKWQGEVWDRRKNGEVYPAWLIITAVKRDDGVITHFVGSHVDITERKAAEEEIRNLAFYDQLTSLPNRRLLMDRLEQARASSARSGRNGALLFIDLDKFKLLNDTLGHDMGDLLLQQVAQRLTACIREGDTAARLGGDEFVVMLEGLSENISEAVSEAEVVGDKILAALNQVYPLATYLYHNTPSIGGTLFFGHHQTIEELLRQADHAMYQSKNAGRNTLRFFNAQG